MADQVELWSDKFLVRFQKLFSSLFVIAVSSFNLYYPANFTLGVICNALATVKYKWFDIGVQLGVPYHKLKEFEKEDNCLAATIGYFLNGNVKDALLSWDSIVTALKSSSVWEPALARRIQRTYTGQECKSDKSAAKGTILHVYTH